MWVTDEDILNDIPSIGYEENSFQGYVVRGQRPPPIRQCDDEDEEMVLRFGGTGDHLPVGTLRPDLNGITEMLRMIDENDQPSNAKGDTLSPCQIVITKLNPKVKEFVPKDSLETSTKKGNENNIEAPVNNNNIDADNKDTKCDVQQNGSSEITHSDLKPTNDESEEILRLEASLKDKIKINSTTNNLKNKRDRNVAIAALLKLHSVQTPTNASPKHSNSDSPLTASSSSSPKPLILFTPEYFEAKRPIVVDIDDTEHSIPQDESNPSNNSSSTEISIDPIDVKPESVELIADPQVQESIEKVNNWFEKPKPKPRMKPQLGAIIYKKKDSPSQSTSTSSLNVHSNSDIAKPVNAVPSFVPSKYASDLAKTYEERNKAKRAQNGNIWTRLEDQLKAKDEEIRRRLRESEDGDESQKSTRSSKRSSRR